MKILFTPDWFFSTDVLIEVFSFLILFLFFVLAFRSYKTSKNKSSLYLGLGFLLIAFGEISTILTKIVLYYNIVFTKNIDGILITYTLLRSVNWFYYIGLFLNKFLTLAGLYMLYLLSINNKKKPDVFLAVYLILISALFSQVTYYVFHITALVLLILIIINYHQIYKKNKAKNTVILLASFILLAISQGIFILSEISSTYIIAQSIQLISYALMLFLIIRILYYPDEKIQNGKKKK